MTLSRRRHPRSLIQFLADNNPFYLLSAASMLLACLLLSNSTTWSPIATSRLAGLIGTLAVYELLLVGLGLYLITRRGRTRDGIILLTLEAFLLADVGFLSSEAYQESLSAGMWINGALLAVGLAKLAVIFRLLRMPLASPAFALVVVMFVVLLGHPALLKHLGDKDHGRVPELAMYGLWWMLGALVAAYGVALQSRFAPSFRGSVTPVTSVGIGHAYVSVLLVLLLAHVGTAHWVFDCPFRAADLSPLLLGSAVLLIGIPDNGFIRRKDNLVQRGALPIAAVIASAQAPSTLAFEAGPVTITPLMLAVVAAYLVLVYCFARQRFLRFALLGAAAGAAYLLMPSWTTIQGGAERGYRWLAERVDRMVPRSRAAWGVLALLGAFIMLVIGAALSLRPSSAEEQDCGGGSADGSTPPSPDAVGAALGVENASDNSK